MDDKYVEYPRHQQTNVPAPAEVRAALRTWQFGYKALYEGMAGALFTLLLSGCIFGSTLELTLMVVLPFVLGHVTATGHTYRAFRAAGEEFPVLRRWAWVGMLGCFLIPVFGLAIPAGLREWAAWVLRRAGIKIVRPKDVVEHLKAVERQLAKPSTTREASK